MAGRTRSVKKRPKIPVCELVQEAVDLKIICTSDKDALDSQDFDWEKLEGIEQKASKCAAAEAAYIADKADCTIVTQKLNVYKKECIRLRSSIAGKLREITSLKDSPFRIPGYSRKNGYADIVQDLHDLYWVIGKHEDYLLKNKFNISQGEKAKDASGRLAKMVAFAANEKPWLLPNCAKRDKLRDELYELVQSIRKIGRAVFQDDPERRRRYASNYRQKWKKGKKKNIEVKKKNTEVRSQ